MIQKPHIVADIPQDLAGSSGQILATDVYAVAGSKKRKRSEIALAIDGQGIDIYDVIDSLPFSFRQLTGIPGSVI